MTRLQFFESGYGLISAKLGIISIDLLTKYDSYKTYLEFRDQGYNEGESRILASDKCRCHYTSIARAIYWFESDITVEAKPIRITTEQRGRRRLRIDEKPTHS